MSRRTLREYCTRPGRYEAEPGITAWIEEVESAEWRNFREVKASYASASSAGDSRIVFNIAGNKHRLVVFVNYEAGIVFVKFLGTHAEYDRIDARTVNDF